MSAIGTSRRTSVTFKAEGCRADDGGPTAAASAVALHIATPPIRRRIRLRATGSNSGNYSATSDSQDEPACPDKRFYRQREPVNERGRLLYRHRAIEPTLV